MLCWHSEPIAAMSYVIAIDLGGTKISAALVDETGDVQRRAKVGTPKQGVAERIAEVVRSLNAASQATAVGLIVPGIYFPNGGKVWAPNVFGDEHYPLRRELEARLGTSVIIDSDRSGYVMGEQWLGAAQGLSDVIFLAVGTGIGAGILSGGRLIRGPGGVAGAVGWFALTPEHKQIYSQIGCFEAEAAGPAVARRFGAPDAEAVAAAARAGDPKALEAFARTAEWLSMGIANLISALNPQMIVLGGGLMQTADLLLDSIREYVPRYAQPIAARQVRIELTRLGEDAGLLGAARLALLSNE